MSLSRRVWVVADVRNVELFGGETEVSDWRVAVAPIDFLSSRSSGRHFLHPGLAPLNIGVI